MRFPLRWANWFVVCALFAVLGAAYGVCGAQEPAAPTPAELLEQLNDVVQDLGQAESEEQQLGLYEELAKTAEEALSLTDAEEVLSVAARRRLDALMSLIQLDAPDAQARFEAALEAMAADERAAVQREVVPYRLYGRLVELGNAELADVRQFGADVLAALEDGPVDDRMVFLAFQAAQVWQQHADAEGLAAYLERLSEFCAASDNPGVRQYAEQFAGQARQLRLVGGEIELEGALLSGEPLNWDDYRGKVVLVDFWATWCGPCVAELPNVLQAYERYHDQGFEVLGISLDDDREALVQFIAAHEIPWPVMFESAPLTQGWSHPMAVKYGVQAIPTAILVDREGRVVTLSARGEELQRLLADLIGAETATDE